MSEIFSVDWTGERPPVFNRKALPKHVAVVMDGNGRWAKQKGLPRIEGHKAGEDALIDVVAGAVQLGVPYLSLYVFSTENWLRSPDEVRFLLGFTRGVLQRRRPLFDSWGVRMRWSGTPKRLPKALVEELRFTQEATKHNQVMDLNVCLNYGSRQELVDAAKALAAKAAEGKLAPSSITAGKIARELYLPDFPDVDLFVRSSGEKRLSNFLLWQCAYAELVFMDTLWPDFRRKNLWEAVSVYSDRNRRFGKEK